MDSRTTPLRGASLGSAALLASLAIAACDTPPPPETDAGPYDAGPVEPLSIDHCEFTDIPPTGHAGGTVEAGALTAGVAERMLDVPLGSAVGSYTDRAEGAGRSGFLPAPDERRTGLAGTFAPSVGIETAPRIRALALSAGGETVVIMKLDLSIAYQALVHEVEANLGPDFSGKVIISMSHSHSSFGNYTGHTAMTLGFSEWRSRVFNPMVTQITETAQAAIDALEPAQIGFSYNGDFDPDNRVNRDRRSENDDLAGGSEDDHHLYMIRVDTAAGEPMAMVPVFGMHGTLQSGRNTFISTDSTGGLERVLEEEFDSNVLVMHLQGAGGDVSPAGSGSIECDGEEVCADFAKAETIGHFARAELMAAFEEAGAAMETEVPMEMLTRTVPLGPDWETFTIRNGDLRYAPFDLNRDADNEVFDSAGNLISPIDEFNAPAGAALCDPVRRALVPRAQMPGTQTSDYTYRGCNRIEHVGLIYEVVAGFQFEDAPFCETVRTTVSALRIGDWMIGTMPGETVTLLADHVRTLSPMPADHTIVVSYAQDHGGYLLGPEDWLSGGYEPSITFWGPLEGEYVAEQLGHLLTMAGTDDREDASAEGMPRVASPSNPDPVVEDDAQNVGTVPAAVPDYLFTRLLRPVSSMQPAASVARLETVYFTFIGDDPLRGTPRVFLQRESETDPGVFEDVLRRSGRPVQDGDIILSWTPDPIQRGESPQRTHYYTVEFQAAAPLGMPGLEALGARRGLPLGNYRFRIESPTFDLVSDAFEVTPATLMAATETSGADVTATLGVEATSGFRLLDMGGARSNRLVPLRGATIEAMVDGTPATLTADDNGVVTVPGAASAASVTLTDEYGNTTTL